MGKMGLLKGNMMLILSLYIVKSTRYLGPLPWSDPNLPNLQLAELTELMGGPELMGELSFVVDPITATQSPETIELTRRVCDLVQ